MVVASIKKGYIEDWICQKVLEKMYDQPDQEVLAKMFARQQAYRNGQPASAANITALLETTILNRSSFKAKKMSRDEQIVADRAGSAERLLFADFLKCILDF